MHNQVNLTYGNHVTQFGEAVIIISNNSVVGLGFIQSSNPLDTLGSLVNLLPYKTLNRDQNETAKFIKQIFHITSQINISMLLNGTDFEFAVWHALLDIPVGETISYQDLAKNIGKPKAARAVANAVGANRISYVIPCHRVIRSNGEIGGYRWGINCKQKILNWERKKACKKTGEGHI